MLIHAAAGGVGGFAVQLARDRGAQVIGTASAKDIEAVRRLGAGQVVDYAAARFEDVVAPVDLVFDTVGGDTQQRSFEVLRRGGRLVTIASEPSQARAAETGVTAVYFVVEPNREQLAELAGRIDGGGLRPTIDAVFPLGAFREAFERSLGRHGPGKIVLRVVEEE